MLFESDRHEALAPIEWNEERARAAVRDICAEIERERGADSQWPLHPLDDEGDVPRSGFKGLYLGSAGVVWALHWLQREGAIALGFDTAAAIEQALAAYRAEPDSGEIVPSFWLGEAGILLVQWRLTGSREVADRLHAVVRSNIGNPTNESLWGAPGTMLAAWHLWQATHEARWRELYLDNAEDLWRNWRYDEQAQCHLWTQDLYGRTVQYLGAGHGFAGNVYPLLVGAALLDAPRREALYQRCVQTLSTLARREGEGVNWPPGTYTPRPGGPQVLVQWCHGAPGIVTALAGFPRGLSAELDALLVGAGQAIWQAGPLTKGPGLCHGTAGNGLAFLALHQRTGEAAWLARARAFGMHALQQRERQGQNRCTLWTGDAGLAVYLWQCIGGQAGLPTLDLL